jgi:GT2 family glycosyltransferase
VNVSICILTHNQPELLPLCVASCFEEIERAGIAGEVIVIDNASTDRYPEKLRETYPQVRIIRNEQNLGFSAGNNIGIRASQGRYILILNDDAILQPGSLGLMLWKMESDPKIGAIGPKLLNPDGSIQKGFSNKRAVTVLSLVSDILYLNGLFDRWQITRVILTRMNDDEISGEPAEVAGACLLIKREALDQVGLFDETFYYSSEDTDLCYRLRGAGWKILYLAETHVTHYGSASFRRFDKFERIRIFYQSQMHLLKKHWSPLHYQCGRILLALVFLVRAPLAFIRRVGLRQENLEEARRSAAIAIRMARWLITECQ